MRIAGKEFSWYIEAIKWPVILLSLWNIVGAVVLRRSPETYMDVFGNQWASMFVPIVMYVVAGYLATADYGASAKQASWSGALTGIIVGIVGVIILAVNFSAMVDLSVEQAASAAAEQGQALSADDIMPMIKLGMYISAVFGPIIAGLFGALIGWIGYLLAKRIEGKN